MFTFEVERWIPKFILNDKNGYAIAKAIQAGIQYMNDTVAAGLALIDDVESMPEWRLDELAWEHNIPYDYQADIEIKRRWIENIYPLYRIWGTKAGISQYLDGYFDETVVKENWEYGGQPYHFKVDMSGEWTIQSAGWAVSAIEKIKNLRSVVDGFSYEANTDKPMPDVYKITIQTLPDQSYSILAESKADTDLLHGIAPHIKEDRTVSMDETPISTLEWYADRNDDVYTDEEIDILTR